MGAVHVQNHLLLKAVLDTDEEQVFEYPPVGKNQLFCDVRDLIFNTSHAITVKIHINCLLSEDFAIFIA